MSQSWRQGKPIIKTIWANHGKKVSQSWKQGESSWRQGEPIMETRWANHGDKVSQSWRQGEPIMETRRANHETMRWRKVSFEVAQRTIELIFLGLEKWRTNRLCLRELLILSVFPWTVQYEQKDDQWIVFVIKKNIFIMPKIQLYWMYTVPAWWWYHQPSEYPPPAWLRLNLRRTLWRRS
jgi:hypothetical protein